MTLTPWSHAPAEDPKRPTKQPTTTEKNHKNEEKRLFKGEYASCTTDRSRVMHGLIVQQVTCTSTRGSYY